MRIFESDRFVIQRLRDGKNYVITWGSRGWLKFPTDQLEALRDLIDREIADAPE